MLCYVISRENILIRKFVPHFLNLFLTTGKNQLWLLSVQLQGLSIGHGLGPTGPRCYLLFLLLRTENYNIQHQSKRKCKGADGWMADGALKIILR